MDSLDTSWHFGPEAGSGSRVGDFVENDQDLDFQIVASDEGIGYGLLKTDDEELLEELFPAQESGEQKLALAPISKPVSFDQGFVLAVRGIQLLRSRKRGLGDGKVIVGIGGPRGSGKTSLAHKIASVVGCVVISLENYVDVARAGDENYETFGCFDGALLNANLEDILNNRDTEMPLFDFHKRERVGFRPLKASDCQVVVLEGFFALHEEFSRHLDMKVSIVGGAHYNLVKRVYRALNRDRPRGEEQVTEEAVLKTVFSSFKEHVEPHLRGAHIVVKNDFDHLTTLREPLYVLRARGEPNLDPIQHLLNSGDFTHASDKWIDTHIRPPGSDKLKEWLRIRQCGGMYSITFCEWIVEGDFIISPRVTFATSVKTLGGLLSLGYEVGTSISRSTDVFTNGEVTICVDLVEDIGETFISIKGVNRGAVLAAARDIGVDGGYTTKSMLQVCLQEKGGAGAVAGAGQPRSSGSHVRDEPLSARPQKSLPMRLMQAAAAAVSSNAAAFTADIPADKAKGLTSEGPRSISPTLYRAGRHVELVPITRELSFDHGLLLAVRGVQKLREHRGASGQGRFVIVGIGGPSGSGKSRLARNMAGLLNCDVVEMENYFVPSKIYEDNFDEVNSLDTDLLCSHLEALRRGESISIPQFDLAQRKITGHRSFSAQASGMVIVEGVYALHKKVRPLLDFRVAVVGGVHFNLVKRVHRDAEAAGRCYSHKEVLDTIFPLFRQHIEPGLRHSHLRVRNSFDPLTSLLTPQYVLKSAGAAAASAEQISKLEATIGPLANWTDTRKVAYVDIYLVYGKPLRRGEGAGGEWIRVRQCGGRYTILFRDSLREGDFIIQPCLDFEVGVKTLAGLLCLGYQIVALVEANVTQFQSEKLSVTLEDIFPLRETYLQIKGAAKENVQACAAALGLKAGDFTTKSFIELIHDESCLSPRARPVRTLGSATDSSAAKLRDFLTNLAENNSIDDLTDAIAARHEHEIAEIRAELQRLNRTLMLSATLGGVCIPIVGAALGCILMYYANANKRSLSP